MGTTRRTLLGGALTAPFLAHFTATAVSATPNEKWGSVSDAWVEIRWTRHAQAQLDRFQATVAAVAPAKLVKDADGIAMRFPVRTATGDPSLARLAQAQGSGRLDGGVIVRAPSGEARVVNLESVLTDGMISGKCTVNGIEGGAQSVCRCDLAKGRLVAAPVPPGQPMKIRITGVPVRPTEQSLKAFTEALGAPPFTVDTVMGHLTAEGTYTPPKP
ncbi:hypothetical protein [Allokutzneria albata]|uniref:Uncharacterized protein n=1 Tax=Allokutzneria albata TaxID=211114 RepID=A0A1G9U274_ALLAB|nr:hypothetical protein [Allokutzneria albata]SDM54120.1 hypothetical protein SAMN04489726_2136 [Allokutzneria albata]